MQLAVRVRRMIVIQGVRVVALGVVLGVGAGVLASRALRSMLFRVEAVDPGAFAAAAVLMLAVGALASYVPARRASAVDPIQSMR